MITIEYFKTPVGELILGEYQEQLVLADWRYRKMRIAIDNRIQKAYNCSYILGKSKYLGLAKKQLDEYFRKERKEFDLPLIFTGTEFQKEVWNALQQIPYGETRSYLQLAKDLGNEKAVRAVATANGANVLSIIVPCHRVIGSNGNLVGYAGGLPAKKRLLELENISLQQELF